MTENRYVIGVTSEFKYCGEPHVATATVQIIGGGTLSATVSAPYKSEEELRRRALMIVGAVIAGMEAHP